MSRWEPTKGILAGARQALEVAEVRFQELESKLAAVTRLITHLSWIADKRFDGWQAISLGEVFIVAGYDGHEKSQMVGHMILGLLRQGVRARVALLQFRTEAWLARLTRQAASLRLPSAELIRAVHRWYDDRLRVAELVGHTSADILLLGTPNSAARGRELWHLSSLPANRPSPSRSLR